MPYRKRGTKRTKSRSYSGRSYRNKGSNSRASRTIIRNPRSGGFIGVETKYYDAYHAQSLVTSSFTTAVKAAATSTCLNSPTQGTGVSNRDGRSIYQRGIRVNYDVHWLATSNSVTPEYPSMMFAVVLDTQCNQTALTSAALIFTTLTSQILTVPFRDMEYTTRFKVLCKVLINPNAISACVTPGSATETTRVGYHKSGSVYCNLKGLRTQFNANAGNVTDISDNALYLVAIANDSSSHKSVYFTYESRLYFTSAYVK